MKILLVRLHLLGNARTCVILAHMFFFLSDYFDFLVSYIMLLNLL